MKARRIMIPRSAPLPLLLALACGEPLEPTLETEHLRFHGDLDGACPALGRVYEREVSRLESVLGRELLEPIEVVLGEDAVAERCDVSVDFDGRPPSGCAHSGNEITTTLDALSHEIVHAVRLQHGFETVPLIEEGLATMLGTARPVVPFSARVTASNPDLAPILFLDRDWDQATFADYVVGSHFLHWADQAYGRDPFLDFLWSDDLRVAQSSEAIQAAFAANIGETMLDAQARWSDEAEREATFSDLCWGMDVATLPTEGLHVQASACCSDPTVEQSEPPFLNVGRRCFTVPTAMELTAELDAAEGELILRPDGCYGPVVTLDPGETITFTATPCVWQALVFTPERCDDAGGVRYTIDPQ